MFQRLEFVMLAMQTDNFSELCDRFGISRKTGYKFLNRYLQEGEAGLYDRSRRPKSTPKATAPEIEQVILELRDKYPAWGPRKLKRRLEDLGHQGIPAPSTINGILKRCERIAPEAPQTHKPWQRFERERPNDLWQMDFKGHFAAKEGRCHPLTVLDDHSRYSLGIRACKDEKKQTVQYHLKTLFRRYGLPWAMLMDNGNPWGYDNEHPYTRLTVWLIRLGISIIHSGAYHPQTLGKDERFHRTLKAEVIGKCIGRPISTCQWHFDRWRSVYNTQRPHEALDMNVPAAIKSASDHSWKNCPKLNMARPIRFDEYKMVALLAIRIGNSGLERLLKANPVAIRPTQFDGNFEVFFCHQKIAQINLCE
jgi:transposase InsO family protein